MTMNPKLQELLGKPAESFVPPPVLPVGTYAFVVLKHEFGESSKKKTPYVRFHCRPQAAQDDVDQEALAAYGPFNKELRLDFYLTEDALFRINEFMEKLGMNTKTSLVELIQSVPGTNFLGVVSHTVGDDRRPYANISDVIGPVQ